MSRVWSFVAVFPPAIVLFLVCLLTSGTSVAQLPSTKLTSVTPAGGKIGSQVELKIVGTDLDEVDQLVFSHAGLKATQKTSPAGDLQKTARRAPGEFVLQIGADVPAGVYEVRAVGRFGMSNPRAFHVAGYEELSETGNISSREQAMPVPLGSVVSGRVDADSIDYFKITAEKGQRLLVDCWAQRVDSRMDGTLVLYDPDGRELRRVRDVARRDPVLDLTAPVAGDYVVGLYDFTYGGGAEHFYRLAVHRGPYIDFVFPPVGEAGKNSKFTLYGRNLPGGKPVGDMKVDGGALEQVEVSVQLPADAGAGQAVASLREPHQGRIDTFAYQFSSPQGASNVVDIGYAAAPVVVEQEPNDDPTQPQRVAAPCEYAGQFYPKRDRDWIEFSAKAGEVWWIDLVSHRMGLDSDPYLVVQQVTKNDNGEESVSQVTVQDDLTAAGAATGMFDMRTRDPRYRLEAKADASFRIGVSDLYGGSRGDPRLVYRLVIRKEQPDFRLLAYCQPSSANKNALDVCSPVLRRGGAAMMKVRVVRRDGFDGEVEITAVGLPQGVRCDGAVVGGKVDSAALIFTADENAPAWSGGIQILGKAKIDGKDVARSAQGGAVIWGTKNIQSEAPYSRLTRDIGFSVMDKETVPVSVTAGDGGVIETCVGAKVDIPLKVARRDGFKGAVKLKATELPVNSKAADANVTAAEGKLALDLANTRIEAGSYTFYLAGPVKYKYRRNPDAETAAQAYQKETEEVLKSLTESAKAAAATAKQARDKANQEKEDKAAADAAAKAEAEAKELESKRKQAEANKKKADQDLTNTKNANKEKDVTVNVVSTPVKLRIARTPVSASVQPPGGKLQQGQKLELPVTVERKYGFEDAVEVSLEPPKGVAGVSAKKLTIAKGQTQGKLEVALAATATPGEHQFTLRARTRFNNVQADQTQPVKLAVEKKPD